MNTTELRQLKQYAKYNTYVVHGNIDKADCLIGFSFGYVEDDDGIKPGKSNEQLAEFIENNFPTTPLILQFEINDALQYRTASLVISKSRQEGEYLNSREIAEQALIYMKENSWQIAAIVTHSAMEARNDALCQKLGISTVTPYGLEVIEYDTNSVQHWTVDKNSWWKREDKVIDKCLENGWL